jgi:uncharacterized protein with HEPN domain
MPSRNWRLRLQDILQSIDEIQQRTAGMDFENFITNRLEIVWIAIQNNLPLLVSPLQEILHREASGE